jgi:hypothetical protein
MEEGSVIDGSVIGSCTDSAGHPMKAVHTNYAKTLYAGIRLHLGPRLSANPGDADGRDPA